MKNQVVDLLLDIDTLMREIENKKILIYGLDEGSKFLFNWTINNDIYVTGFLLPDNQKDLKGIKYLNKLMYLQDDINDSDEYVVIGFFIGQIELNRCDIKIINVSNLKTNSVIIYGAGKAGKEVFELMEALKIDVKCFCDRDENKQKKSYCGRKVCAPEELKQHSDVEVIVAMMGDNSHRVACDLVENKYVERAIYYRWENSAYVITNDEKPVMGKLAILYLFESVIGRGYKVALFGRTNDIIFVANKLKLMDISVCYGIASDAPKRHDKEIRFIDFYDLFYETEKVKICAIRDVVQLKKLIEESGIDPNMFLKSSLHCDNIYADVCLDASLGNNQWYKKWESLIPIPPVAVNNVKKVVILGGSTSHLYAFPEISLPEQFLSVAREHGNEMQVLAGGVCGYGVANELIKLIRDVIPLKPDVVISYSGVNEGIGEYTYAPKGYFCSNVHKLHYDFLEKHTSNEHEVIYGTEKICSIEEYWMMRERMMHAICDEFGIKFFAFAQPSLCTKKSMTIQEKEVLEHFISRKEDFYNAKEVLNNIGKLAKNESEDWIFDMTHFFDESSEKIYIDNCHLSTLGNQKVAEYIYEIISKKIVC